VNGNGANLPSNFVRLRGAHRIWAVAAIHGEAERLARLHDRIAARFAEGDRIVYLGNYIGHGAAIQATLDELLDFRRRILARPHGFACDVVFLRGAQEEIWQKLLQLQFAANPGEVLAWMVRAGAEETVRAYGGELRHGFAASRDGPRAITRWTSALRNSMNAAPGHTKLFATLRHAAVSDDERLLFVHAGIDPSRALSAQGDAFWWGENDILDLAEPFLGFKKVIRGFDRQRRGLIEGGFAASLDAGAGRGGPLLAAAFGPDGAVLEVLQA
jgi:serine/threonine protein phosphatase 1